LNQPSSLKKNKTIGQNVEEGYSEAEYLQDPSEVKARLRALRDSSIQQGYKLLEPGYDINKYKEGFNQEEKKQYEQLKKSGLSDDKINQMMYLFAKNNQAQPAVAKNGAVMVELNPNTLGFQDGGSVQTDITTSIKQKPSPTQDAFDAMLAKYEASKEAPEEDASVPEDMGFQSGGELPVVIDSLFSNFQSGIGRKYAQNGMAVPGVNGTVVANTNAPVAEKFKKAMEEGGELEEEEDDDDKEMVDGVASILRRVKDKNNRQDLAKQLAKQFDQEEVKYNLADFLKKSKVKK
jgi:hypothetical protein